MASTARAYAPVVQLAEQTALTSRMQVRVLPGALEVSTPEEIAMSPEKDQ